MDNPHPREETLFALAQEKPAAERAAFLDGACHGDSALRERLEILLAAHEQTEGLKPLSPDLADPTVKVEPIAEFEDDTVGSTIGRYKLLQKIGEGGCGAVYMAEQTAPVRRRVALKVIKLGMDTKAVIARFEAERQALALMDHPNIAKVLDGGASDAGRPYFVMELVRGIKITDYCDRNKLDTKPRLKLFIQICQAIQHAHQKGIIHRDIKPSNILVTLHDGIPLPKVIDFGIAKATTDQRLTDKTLFTAYEQFIGTPAYMSPEQAEMSPDLSGDIDTRSDIYSLGVLLYELLTGRTPFDPKELMESGLDAMRRTIREKEPLRPSMKLNTLQGEAITTTARSRGAEMPKLIHLLRGDLDWIVMKCLEKDRTRRYETANGLAMDINRHLNLEPVEARPPSKLYEFRKTVRRHTVGFAATAAVILALTVGVVSSTWQAALATKAKQEAQSAQADATSERRKAEANERKALDAQQEAKKAELKARRRAYAADMNVAKQALDSGNLGRVRDLLDDHRPKADEEEDLRGWEWRYLWGQTRSDALYTLCRQPRAITSLAVSSQGDWLAVGTYYDGGLTVWDMETGQPIDHLVEKEEWVKAAFSPAEPLLAITSSSNSPSGALESTLRLWNAVTRQVVAEFPLDGNCVGLAFSEDGRRLVTSTIHGHISLWDVQARQNLTNYPSGQTAPGNPLEAFAVTTDLSLAAYAEQRERIHVLRLRDGKEIWDKPASKEFITALAFSPDGKILASAAGYSETDIRLWDVATGEEIGARLEGHDRFVSSLVFWPDGQRLASGSGDRTIRIWNVESRQCTGVLRGHRQEVWHLELLPDGKLVSGSKDGEVCVWNTSVRKRRQPYATLPGNFGAWCFERDGQSLLTVGQGRVTRWTGKDFQQGEPLTETREPLKQISQLHEADWTVPYVFSAHGEYLAVRSTEAVEVWDLQRGTVSRHLTNQIDSVSRLVFIGDGKRLITVSTNGVLESWDLETERIQQRWTLPTSARANRIAISQDARQAIALTYKKEIGLWASLVDGSQGTFHLEGTEVSGATFSPNGDWLAVSCYFDQVRVWEHRAGSWQKQATLGGFVAGAASVAFSSDGKRLATGGDAKRDALRLWDTASWRDTLTLDGEGTVFHSVAVSPDGNTIGAMSSSGILHLWRAPSWEEIETAEAKHPPAPSYGATRKTEGQQP